MSNYLDSPLEPGTYSYAIFATDGQGNYSPALTGTETIAPSVVEKADSDVVRPLVAESIEFATVSVSASDILRPQVAEGDVLYPGNVYPGAVYPGGGGSEIVVTEAVTFTEKTADDVLTPVVNDSSTLHSAGLAQDNLIPTISEERSIVKGGLFEKEAFSDLVVGVSDSSQGVKADVESVDSLVIVLSEDIEFATVDVRASDSTLVVVDDQSEEISQNTPFVEKFADDPVGPVIVESTSTYATGVGADFISPSITEDRLLYKTGLFERTAVESIRPVIVDSSSIVQFKIADDSVVAGLETVSTPPAVSGGYNTTDDDALAVAITEESSVEIFINRTDSLATSISDGFSFAPVAVAGADGLAPVLTEAMQFSTVEVIASDLLSPGLIEPTPVVNSETIEMTIVKETDDSLNVVVEDIMLSKVASSSGEDILAPSFTEDRLIEKSGLFIKNANDELLLSVTEEYNRVITEIPIEIIDKSASDSIIARVYEYARTREKKIKIKIWNGSAYVEGYIRVDTSTSWHTPNIRAWNGREWI